MSALAGFWMMTLGFSLLTLASVGARVLYEVAWHELKEYCLERNRRELFDEIHDTHDSVLLSMESLRTVATFLIIVGATGWFVAGLLSRDPVPDFVGLGMLLDWFKGLLLAMIIGGVWLPYALSDDWGPFVLFRFWRVFRALSWLMMPVDYCGTLLQLALNRMSDSKQESEEEAFEDEVLAIVTEGMHDGHLEADAREMIEGVMDLGDTDVADIMTRRSDMDAFSIDWEWPEILRFVVKCGRTRIPVYRDNLDNIVGILYVKDLLAEFSANQGHPESSLEQLIRETWYVPPTQNLDELLKDFRKTRNHLAIVRDEFSRVAGLVTIEDVLEEIVGEIVDETDPEEVEEIRRINATTALIQGRAHLDEVNAMLGLDLPEPEDFDTIAGYVVSQLGRIPKPGEQFTNEVVRITVLQASKRKVERVKLESIAHE